MDRKKDEFRHGGGPHENRLATGLAGGEGSLAATVPTVEQIADALHEQDKRKRYAVMRGGAAIE